MRGARCPPEHASHSPRAGARGALLKSVLAFTRAISILFRQGGFPFLPCLHRNIKGTYAICVHTEAHVHGRTTTAAPFLARQRRSRKQTTTLPFQSQASTFISTSPRWLHTMTKRGSNPQREKGRREERRYNISAMQLHTCSQRHRHSRSTPRDGRKRGRGGGGGRGRGKTPNTTKTLRAGSQQCAKTGRRGRGWGSATSMTEPQGG